MCYTNFVKLLKTPQNTCVERIFVLPTAPNAGWRFAPSQLWRGYFFIMENTMMLKVTVEYCAV